MALKKKLFTPWSSLDNMLGRPPAWWPKEEQQRIQSYLKYDEMYWNDPTQYAIRVLENEQPIYVPNARIVVDTTSQWLMKGLQIVPTSSSATPDVVEEQQDDNTDRPPLEQNLINWMRRERFMSKYNMNKKAGVTRGDSAFHITADPTKPEGSRVSIDTLHPSQVWRVTDDDDPDDVIRIHIVELYTLPNDDTGTEYVRRLTYNKLKARSDENPSDIQRITREENVYKLTGNQGEWWGPTPELVKVILPLEMLPEQITQFPVYWFNNIEWESQLYGSSELRGLEYLDWAASQGTTDTQMALSLHGLGVYATDGGRPVDDTGAETDWEVVPGGVMEVPSGSYFRRVEGVGSIQPMMDQLSYLEGKMFSAAGLTDVAMGQVDVKVAQSGIALAIKFMPTLARIEDRDVAQTELLYQMFYDLRQWFVAYEQGIQLPEIDIRIAKNKLPANRTETLNELNNMYDRNIISRAYYRDEAAKLGYIIPEDEDKNILKEAKMTKKINEAKTPPATMQATPPAPGTGAGAAPATDATGGNNSTVDNQGNQSNNRTRTNESSGTEATQKTSAQTKS